MIFEPRTPPIALRLCGGGVDQNLGFDHKWGLKDGPESEDACDFYGFQKFQAVTEKSYFSSRRSLFVLL